MRVENIGGGPALGRRAFVWPERKELGWFGSNTFDLGVGTDVELSGPSFKILPGIPEHTWFNYGSNPDDPATQATVVVFWRDILGWRYRLPVRRLAIAPDRERPTDPY